VPGSAAPLVEQSFAFALDPLDPSEVVVGLGLGEFLVQICDAAPEPGAVGEVEDVHVVPGPGQEDGEVVAHLAWKHRLAPADGLMA